MCSWEFLKNGWWLQWVGKRRGDRARAKPSVTARDRGILAEDRALDHLQRAGLRLVARNYRTPGRGGGEIDLIVRESDGTLVFVEVRSRARNEFGGAGASIGAIKQQRVVFAARHFLAKLPAPPPCRFDVILVQETELLWLRAAFDAPN